MIKERLKKLRQKMIENNVDAYIIPTSDFHETEYVCEYFACRKYMSGFTGSAGVLVVLQDEAALWTDGRYFIQAANQLENTGITLKRQGQEGVEEIDEYIIHHLNENQVVGFDGRVMNYKDAKAYQDKFEKFNLNISTNMDLVSDIWYDRTELPSTPTFHYGIKFFGEKVDSKLARLRAYLEKENVNGIVLTKVDEIAWLYNLRAHDIPNFPVAMAYSVVTLNHAYIYIDSSRLDETSEAVFKKNKIDVRGYWDIYEDVKKLNKTVLVDPSSCNWSIVSNLKAKIKFMQSPIILWKAIKNETELKCTKWAHIKDGVACTKLMYWLKKNVGKEKMTECSIQSKLQVLRSEQENYIEDSFDTICAYKDHAAMMHYSSTKETDVSVKAEGMLLIDSGGQYLEGTTDITRTYVLGLLSDEEKTWFTRALRSHIRLANAHFLYGCTGLNLDILARGPLWDYDMDYQCGTGHGVGHLLNVHEAPNGFRWKMLPHRNEMCVLEPGMITSNEPGVYQEGKFGIRHENEMVVVEGNKNQYGKFMAFEPLTYVPFDLDGIDKTLLTEDEITWLNKYHKETYEKISPYLNEEEASWLKEACRNI